MPNAVNRNLHNAYVQMALERLDLGFVPYLLTLMFNPLPGSPNRVQATMMQEAEWLYGQILTRLHRHPRRMQMVEMPLWIVAPDFPVPKTNKQQLRDVSINDGRHLHAAVLIPPHSRLELPFNLYLTQNADRYAGSGRWLARIDIRGVYDTPAVAFGYAFKALERGTAGSDDMMVLPRSHSEMPSATPNFHSNGYLEMGDVQS